MAPAAQYLRKKKIEIVYIGFETYINATISRIATKTVVIRDYEILNNIVNQLLIK